MSYNWSDPKVGEVVYKAFEPKKPMKIMAVELAALETMKKIYWNMPHFTDAEKNASWEQSRRRDATLTLKDAKGNMVKGIAKEFKDFEELVLETEKKAKNHRDRFNQIKNL